MKMLKAAFLLVCAACSLLGCHACPRCDAPKVTVVTSAQQLKEAVVRGDAHIELQDHVDMTTIEPVDFRALGVLPETIKSIRGACKAPMPTAAAAGLSGAPLLPAAAGTCLIATDTDLLYAWEGSVWLSQLYVRMKRTARTDLPVLLHVNSSPAGQLWVTDSVLQGDAQGSCRALYADGSAFLQGTTVADMSRTEASVISRAGRTTVSLKACTFLAAPAADAAAAAPHMPALQAQAASSFRLEGVSFERYGNVHLLLDSQGTSAFYSDAPRPVWNEETREPRGAHALADAAGRGWLSAEDSWLQEVQKVLPGLRRQAAPAAGPSVDARAALREAYMSTMRAIESLPLKHLPLEHMPLLHLGPGPQVAALAAAVLLPLLLLVLLCVCVPMRARPKTKVA